MSSTGSEDDEYRPDRFDSNRFGDAGNLGGDSGEDAGIEFGELKETGPSYNPYNSGQPVHSGYYSNPATVKQPSRPTYLPEDPPPRTTASGILVNAFCLLGIVGLASFICYMQNQPATEEIKTSPQADLFELTYQAKMQLGLKVLAEENQEIQDTSETRIDFGHFGSVRMRQAGAVMLAELETPDDALSALWQLKTIARQQDYEFTETEERTTRILEDIYGGNPGLADRVKLSAEDREHLEKELLWFGKLAQYSRSNMGGQDSGGRRMLLQEAENMVMRLLGVGLTIVLSLLVGFGGAIALFVMYANGNIKIRTLIYSRESSIYLEAFFVWILSYLLISLILGTVAADINPLLANAFVFFGSLGSSLLWPTLRGKFDSQFRKDIGLSGNPLRELPISIWCYICSLPLIAIGFFITRGLMTAYAEPWGDELTSTAPAHPMMEWVMESNPIMVVGVFFVACVCAPVVEEICFRGFLYRAIKDNSHGLGHFASSFTAAVVNGILFAAIHPQGIFFIPALCALGMAFSIAREWRGSLWAPMFMHAIHNFLVTMAVILFVA